MITQRDLQEAIAECQGKRNPVANDCLKLAAFYTIQDHMYPEPAENWDSFSQAPAPSQAIDSVVDYPGESEFCRATDGKYIDEVWPVMDELMTVLSTIHPRLYEGVMIKLRDIPPSNPTR